MIHKLLSISLPYGTLVQIFSSIFIIFVSFRQDEYRIWLGIDLKSLLKCRVGCWSLGISWTIIQYTRNDNHCYWYTSQLFASRVLENWRKTDENWRKLTKTDENWRKLTKTDENIMFKTDENWRKLMKTDENIINWRKLTKTNEN